MTDCIPTIILCGGRGTRISEYSSTIPKPLIPVGPRPILWHIMKMYARHGQTDFVLALGWHGEQIRRYFLDYQSLTNDFTIELGVPDRVQFHQPLPEQGWRITCIDTGVDSPTGTRVRRAWDATESDRIMVTYGDGVSDIDIDALLAHHEREGRLATITAVHPASRFGEMAIDDDGAVSEFVEKPLRTSGAINGGFMVFESEAIRRYCPEGERQMLEAGPLVRLAKDGQLSAYVHHGFWQQMDTPRERELLDEMWTSGQAPWKQW